MAVANGVTYQVTTLLFATVIFARFPPLAGWSVGQVLLIASIRLLGHGLHVLCFGALEQLPRLIREGRLDALRLRPTSLFLQVCTHKPNIHAFGDLGLAVAAFAVCLTQLDLPWTPQRIGLLVVAVVCAVVLELSFVLHIAALVLRFPGATSLFFWLDNTISNFASYPLVIFPLVIRIAFTFVLPVAFIAFYPAAWILGKHDTVLASLSPLVAVAWLASSVVAWRRGLQAYAKASWGN